MPELGQWLPDLPAYGHNGLTVARNTYFLEGGYKPVKDLSAFTAALPAAWAGGGYFKGTGGNTALLAGTAANIYAYSGGAWVAKLAGSYNNWFFNQFGNLVIGTNGGAPVKYDLTAGTAAALGGSPPSSTMSAIVNPGFVFLAGDSSNQNRVKWSGLELPEQWTVGTSQSDYQDLPDGGEITGLAGGEVGLVFQTDGITELAYVGGATIFNVRKVSHQIGAICHGSIAQAGRKYFFLHRRGFYSYENGDLAPIGKFRVDRTFLNTYSLSEIQNNLRAAVDPDRSLVIWAMPGRLWIYNWDQDRWTDIAITGLTGISVGATESVTLETIAVTYPAIESVPVSFDDPSWQGGTPVLLMAKSDGVLYSFGAASSLEATFQTGNVEMFTGREAHVRNVRLLGDPTSATVALDARRKLSDTSVTTSRAELRDNGDLPLRSSGRYQQLTITLPYGGSWTYLQGFDMEASAGGRL